MDAALISLDTCRNVLVAYALLLGAEAAFLLYVAYLARRPWLERALALAPAAGFAWVLWLARGVQLAAAYWRAYLSFQAAHYSPDYAPLFTRQNQRDIAGAVAGATHTVATAGALTLTLLVAGWVVLLLWFPRYHRQFVKPVEPRPLTADDPDIIIEPLERATDG